jgi:hypothetical protein
MHERRRVDEFHDNGEVKMIRPDIPRRTAGDECERGTQPLAAALHRIRHVALDRRIECPRLRADAFLHGVQLGVDQIEGLLERFGLAHALRALGTLVGLCEMFHKDTLRIVGGQVNGGDENGRILTPAT